MKLINTLTVITWVTIILVACGWTSGDTLNGSTWELYSIGRHSPIPGSMTTISFEDGQVSGRGGCNQYGGKYQINEDAITVEELYMTEMACLSPEGIMEQEQRFFQHLGDAGRFELADGQLQVFGSDGEALMFVPAE